MDDFLSKVQSSSGVVAGLSGQAKSEVLLDMAKAIDENSQMIISANKIDMQYAEENEISEALKDRLMLDENRIAGISKSLREISSLRDPVGKVLDGWIADAGMSIQKVSVPIGVIGVIYESRPNVTADVAALCFKSGNAVILKGGKEAENSNKALAEVLQSVLQNHSLPIEIISLLPDSSREGVAKLIKQDKYVDLIVPRGGEALIKFVVSNATVPVVKHDKGLCHTYLDKDADMDKSLSVIVNAKCRRTGICGAMETLLIDSEIADVAIPKVVEVLKSNGVELRGCDKSRKIANMNEATVEDFKTEYLDSILSIAVVDGVEGAMSHIGQYGSGHSDAILTENHTTAEKFLNGIDSACVYLNASTQFTDGGEFGFGAEVGISTNKLHARGPMGIGELTTYKYKIYGNGECRA